jgi:hypothetical protein
MIDRTGEIVRTYENDASIIEHYRPYVHDVISHPCGMVKTRVVNADFYAPQATHDMLYSYEALPPFMHVVSQALSRLAHFEHAGYVPRGAVLAAGGTTVKQMVHLHERGATWLTQGYLLGPYILQGQLLHGVQFFEPPMQGQ